MINPFLNVGFVDTFDGCAQFFMDQLATISDARYAFIRNDENPDILFFGDANFGTTNLQQKYLDVPVRIFYTGENVRPSGQRANYALGFDHFQTDNYMRLPLWVLNIHYFNTRFGLNVLQERIVDDRPFEDRGFCGFVQSNPNCIKRNEIFHLLSDKIQKVDSAGPLFNNVGFTIPRGEDGVMQKIKWLSGYKFTLAAENGQYPGYITEKLLEAKLAGTVPIYYGSETIALDFDRNCFINYHDFTNDDEFIEYVKYVNNNSNIWNIMHAVYPLFGLHEMVRYENLLHKLQSFLKRIVERHFP